MNTPSSFRAVALALATAVVALAQTQMLEAQSPSPAAPATAVVDVVAEDYALSAPAEIPAGWTTFRFRNEGEEPHFLLVARLPAGITIEDYETDLLAQFNQAWYAVRDRGVDPDEAMGQLFEALPEWFPAVEFVGGPGMTAPGRTTEATLNLEPGNYVLECYMKTEGGEFHSMEGMIRPIGVTEARSDAGPPEADIRITLSNFEMAIEGELTPGRHVVEVHIAENPEQGFGHNVHVARMGPETDVGEVVKWMNSFDLGGLRSPGPARFVGGAQIMPAGHTAYFTVDLEPGRYLFVSEYTGHQGVLQEVTVRP
jgi:hypothetical protein